MRDPYFHGQPLCAWTKATPSSPRMLAVLSMKNISKGTNWIPRGRYGHTIRAALPISATNKDSTSLRDGNGQKSISPDTPWALCFLDDRTFVQ